MHPFDYVIFAYSISFIILGSGGWLMVRRDKQLRRILKRQKSL